MCERTIIILIFQNSKNERKKTSSTSKNVLACASIRVEFTIPPSTPSRRSFPACATNASTISERGITYKPFSLDPLFWQQVSNRRQIRWEPFFQRATFSAVSATDLRTTGTRRIKSKAKKKKSKPKTLKFDTLFPPACPHLRDIGP